MKLCGYFVTMQLTEDCEDQWHSQDFKVGGHTGDVAQRAEAGVGFLERGSAAGPLPIS